MTMRVRTGKVTPVLMDRSTQAAERETRADRLLQVVLALLSQAGDAARAGDEVFLARRLREADRVLGYMPPGILVDAVKRAKQRSLSLRRGEIPAPRRLRSANGNLTPTVGVAPKQGGAQRAYKVKKRLSVGTNKDRPTVKGEAKRRLAADLLRRSCYDCGGLGSAKTLTVKSGQPRCGMSTHVE